MLPRQISIPALPTGPTDQEGIVRINLHTLQKFDYSSSAQIKPFVGYPSEGSVKAVPECLGSYVPHNSTTPLPHQLTVAFRREQFSNKVPVKVRSCKHEHVANILPPSRDEFHREQQLWIYYSHPDSCRHRPSDGRSLTGVFLEELTLEDDPRVSVNH